MIMRVVAYRLLVPSKWLSQGVFSNLAVCCMLLRIQLLI